MIRLCSSTSVPGNTPGENRNLRGEMMRYLQKIVYEEDKDQFLQMVTAFQLEYADRSKFMDYFTGSWCTEDKMKVWSRSFKGRQYSHMLTNYYTR
ncbi:hypothetical protein G6F43_014440 [Rhizopus delemar]|nr:hypothetical protein G6F43_014440 [Rhizopus delemar]